MKTWIVGVTGASGSVYALRTIEALLEAGSQVHIVFSEMAEKVVPYETGLAKEEFYQRLSEHFTRDKDFFPEENTDMFAGIASGSYPCDGMVIVPASMSTIGQLAAGYTPSLLTRAADVCLKQRRPLLIVPRETPLTTIHLRNMTTLSECGGVILPASPGFYKHPSSMEEIIDFTVGRILDCLKVENQLYHRWKGEGNRK
ncbi:UbiX family flavin prenyltransferase [Acetivibrio ethanolgignens]|uniref:Flavin prenyltransferase UbiX n=1 Tax=Acetivibrio ethanolgignens TaxID=290052 RepID=A0A0V8QA52_9FIRM|nr:UbiX family flavin prenyltransferase [Acetivibrio ethanolgignens]KSV57457.1 aromatic acid decarboxylase [Acetivibrio ethanolgignens]